MNFCSLDYIKLPDIESRLDRFIYYHIKLLMFCDHKQCARDAADEVKQLFLKGCITGRTYRDIQHFWNSLRRFISDGCHRYPHGWPSSCIYREIPANPLGPRATDTTAEAESFQQVIRGRELFQVIEEECGQMGVDGQATGLLVDGHSYDQIAEMCGCTRVAAIQRVHRGRVKLAAALIRRGLL